ncbi:CBS domain-containing protein [Leptospira noguchii]|uniref:CBS domain-containing protein n=1 Tax=Leptospira noguchii TaxID=28182 RepID=A0A9Q8VTU3_9LEPT|nr:CBS domain-containing protein [Leptospira noguchii]EKR73149.1 CBS domain protein [Leptospira noguchii str. 2006001870]EMS89249.1 CBS domain protein [Leptospira noguchii str. Cascata]EPE85497.1 CBS domain protein [Leptospira noguchii str. 1993005606]TQE73553.1 CBS domain-containing protein [Leptospira noguchii]UOG30777.1 CBS domain-containing protein [Leptospira noguchii]
MFFWITKGISETYIPTVQSEHLHSISPTAPTKKLETGDGLEHRSTNFEKGVHSEYKSNSSLRKSGLNPIESLSSLMAKDLMTSPVVNFLEDDPIERAEEIFVRKRFRHVPVLNQKNTLCGILSDRDWMCWKLEHIPDTKQTIKEVMKTKILSVQIHARIGEISKVLFEERIGCVPIINDRIEVIGIITRSDILRAILKMSQIEFLV